MECARNGTLPLCFGRDWNKILQKGSRALALFQRHRYSIKLFRLFTEMFVRGTAKL